MTTELVADRTTHGQATPATAPQAAPLAADDPRLDTLCLTLPVSWRGTIAQYVGRLHRLYDGKREVRVAYRRDRRKDQLLQENGYLVLRYLAEDLARELDSVLDGILRSLSSRRAAVVSTHTLNIVRGSRP